MNFRLYLLLIPLIYVAIECNVVAAEDLIKDEAQAIAYLNRVNTNLATEMNKNTEAEWNYATDIRDSTAKAREEATKAFNKFQKEQSIETKKYDWTNFEPKNKRQFEKLAIIGTAALTGDDEQNYIKATSNMETTYSTAKVCLGECTCNCNQELDPHLNKIMAESKDYALLEEVWTKWRDVSGKLMRKDFIEYYTLGNKAATLNKLPNKEFKTLDDLWLFPWETPDIKTQTEDLWKKLKPFYEKLHAYVRKHLKKAYPDKMPADGTIPAHLLGNMWAQQWSNIMNTVPGVDPYPDVKTIDVTDEMVKQEKTAKQMFEYADKFFTDLGLDPMTQKFWTNSYIEKRTGVEMVCHASAWDFYTTAGDDFRIKQCTNINMEDLITVHHEMGHIEYFMQYKNQPAIYRDGANAGFHEAIGDLLALSVSTPKHLVKMGLLTLDSTINMDEVNIKYQLKMALDKLAFLPFGFIMDKYRWDVFSGTTSSDHLNKHWWELRGQYQGLSPPVKRSEDDFDPGAKYHIPASVEYIRYFVSHLLQFQFHKALCSFGQKNENLWECDIDGDREAGAKLKAMLTLGSSKPWPEQLKDLTGSDKMDVQPLLDYFQPLITFLDQQLANEPKGWEFNVDDYVGGAHTVITSLTLILSAIFISISLIY